MKVLKVLLTAILATGGLFLGCIALLLLANFGGILVCKGIILLVQPFVEQDMRILIPITCPIVSLTLVFVIGVLGNHWYGE